MFSNIVHVVPSDRTHEHMHVASRKCGHEHNVLHWLDDSLAGQTFPPLITLPFTLPFTIYIMLQSPHKLQYGRMDDDADPT